jgi:NADH:ubiquinone oxidoreductase subunit 4 (subunit M)
MSNFGLLLIAVFLPLFPLSIGFNALFARFKHPGLRLALLFGWPLTGLLLFGMLEPEVPPWLVAWALGTAVFYGFRLLAMREIGLWTGFFATSIWACLWLPLSHGNTQTGLYLVWFGVPLGLLVLLVNGLERRYGAAYTELYGGLAQTTPRFSGIFVVTILAVVATPVFPAFFAMLNMLISSHLAEAAILIGLWALWSWAGIRLIQGMIVGETTHDASPDITPVRSWLFTLLMIALILSGFVVAGDL